VGSFDAVALEDHHVQALQEELEGLRAAMHSRAVIEQAKGIIMGATGCDAEAAFDLLRQQSQHLNRKLRDVAEEVVASAVRRPEAS
jgi:AmiR/NasT family two-component response regulator